MTPDRRHPENHKIHGTVVGIRVIGVIGGGYGIPHPVNRVNPG